MYILVYKVIYFYPKTAEIQQVTPELMLQQKPGLLSSVRVDCRCFNGNKSNK